MTAKKTARKQATKNQQNIIKRLESEIMIVQALYKRYVHLMAESDSDLLNKECSIYTFNNYQDNAMRQVGNALLQLLKNYTRLLEDYTRECLRSRRYDSCKSSRKNDDSDDTDTGTSSIVLSGDTVY